MRKLTFALLGLAGAVVVPVVAGAADIPPAPPPPPAPAYVAEPDQLWTGFYIGIHAGRAWTSEDYADGFFDIDIDGDGRLDGFDAYVLGGQFGHNWQIGNALLGIEADLAWTDLDARAITYVEPGATGTLGLESDWLATIRGRAGYAFDRFLIYATGGAAFTNLEVSFKDTTFTPGGTWQDSRNLAGWTVGAGVEGLITPNLSLRLEYLYVNFGDGGIDFVRGDRTLSSDEDFDAHIIRGGVNYKFDW